MVQKQIKIKVFYCIDQHGNYQCVGASSKENKDAEALAIIQEGLVKKGVNTVSGSFNVNVTLPEPKEQNNA